MRHLDRFVRTAKARGALFQQQFPEGCVPIERGRIVEPIDAYVSDEAAAT
jgi:hypothetical protein